MKIRRFVRKYASGNSLTRDKKIEYWVVRADQIGSILLPQIARGANFHLNPTLFITKMDEASSMGQKQGDRFPR